MPERLRQISVDSDRENGSLLTESEAKRIWQAALNELNDVTADYAMLAESVASSGPNRLVVRFRQVYNSSKSFCERPERRQMLEESVSRAAGRTYRLDFELLREDARHEMPAASPASKQKQRQQISRHPFVERAVAMFEAEIMNVDIGKSRSE